MFEITIQDEKFLAQLRNVNLTTLKTEIYSDARSATGYPYFYPVDLGRGPVKPVRAKALKIPIGGGRFIFRKSAGPAAPRNIRNIAKMTLDTTATWAARFAVGSTIRQWLASFLNGVAQGHAQELSMFTPRKTGKLAESYRPTTTS